VQLTELIREDLVTVDLEATGKWEAIEELIDLLISAHELRLSDRDEAVEAVVAREKSMTTGMEHGLAIPHAAVNCVDDVLAALGISKKGIPFESIDGKPARLVILILIPHGAFQRHVRTLAGIARLGSTPDLRERIFRAESAAEVMQVLRESDYEELE
jgi:mannitol/fructose-specific phosphotransferase system IIA component (Ntr-type)